MPALKDATMKQKYCDWGHVFDHICQHCDREGLWTGNAEDLATEFAVSEDEADEMLSDLAGRGLIEHLYPDTYAIAKWPERDDPGEEELL
jgi:hypothetical protein